MEIKETGIQGLVEIFPKVFGDERGYFFESYSEEKLSEALGGVKFVQDNQSFSTPGVLRGIHLQKKPYEQGKLVRVIQGKVLDVAVDLRKDSPTYGQHKTFILDSERNNMLYVPEGFGHGFATLEPSIFFYKCTNVYNKESESGIVWNDVDLNIDWQIENPIISEKDAVLSSFKDFSNQ